MADISETAATLRFFGDSLDPHDVSMRLGGNPTSGVYKGQLIVGRGPKVARSGRWSLSAKRRQPGDLSGQIEEILSGLTKDLDVWRDISSRFDGCIFVGFFMTEGNEGCDLSSETLKLLTDRGLSLLLDIYSGQKEDDREVYPVTVITSSDGGGYLKLRRTDADTLVAEAGTEYFRGQTECNLAWIDSPAVLFAEMASEWRGWDGTKEWSDHEEALRLSAKVDSLGHVSLDVELWSAEYSSRLRITLVLDAGQLEDVAGRVRKAVPIRGE